MDHIPHKPAGDQLWQASVLDAQLSALLTNPASYLKANFFFGSGNALYGSDLWIGLLALFAPIRLITGNTILAFNLTWHLALVLNAVLMYLAIFRLTHSRWAAIVAGTIFGFGALQINYAQMHFNYAGSWWIPLTFLFSVQFSRTHRWSDFSLAILCMWLQFVTVVTLSYIAGFVLFAFAVVPGLWFGLRSKRLWIPIQMLVVSTLISLLFLPFIVGYLGFSHSWDAQRDISEVQNGSLQLRDYLSPSSRLAWYEALQARFPVPTGERRAFPGFIPLAAGIAGFVVVFAISFREKRRSRATETTVAAPMRQQQPALINYTIASSSLFLLAVVLSLGPNWKWHEVITDIELPYRFLYDTFPNFQAVRIVARFSLMANFALSVLAALLIASLAKETLHRSSLTSILGFLITSAIMVESATVPLNVLPVPQDQDLTTLLMEAPDGPLLFVPVSSGEEVKRIWLTTSAKKGPLVNGYSGAIWPQYWYFRDTTRDVTHQTGIRLLESLRAYGVKGMLIERAVLPDRDNRIWQDLTRSKQVSSSLEQGSWLLLTLQPKPTKIQQEWASLNVFMPLEAAQPAATITVPLGLSNPSNVPWVPELTPAIRTVTVNWIDASGQVTFETSSRLLPPPFIAAGNTHDTLLQLQTPAKDGLYALHLDLPEGPLLKTRVQVGPVASTSFRGTGEGLNARLHLVTDDAFSGKPAERFKFLVTALNLGPVAWEPHANIRLGWRWYKIQNDGSAREMPVYEGRVVLLSHLVGPVQPGNGYAFSGLLRLPDEPGQYVVHLAPLAELVAWFPNDPVVIHVSVKAH
jgi:hypothetical protein